ncbi:MAG: acyltransferase [Gammaproteobacteria bacterium]|nr:acyltransferase [Gammaproteobacteria bacterium]
MFVAHVHNFRGLAISLIVAVHCLSIFDWSGSPELERWLKILLLNATVFFLFIAGYLFQHLSARFHYPDYLKTKFRNVVCPYLVVSIPALFLFTVVMQRPEIRPGFYDQAPWRQIAEFLLTGQHLAPFWFIPTIVVFYLAAPLLVRLDRLPGFYWSLPLWLLVPVFVSRGMNAPLKSFVHFLPVYLLGMAMSRHRHAVEAWLARWWWTLLIPVAALVGAEDLYAQGTHSWYNTLQKILLCPVLFELMRRAGHHADRWLNQAATLSFGIFFLHSYLISASKLAIAKLWGGLPPGSLWALALAWLAAMALSIAVVAGLKRILGHYSRSLIGT